MSGSFPDSCFTVIILLKRFRFSIKYHIYMSGIREGRVCWETESIRTPVRDSEVSIISFSRTRLPWQSAPVRRWTEKNYHVSRICPTNPCFLKYSVIQPLSSAASWWRVESTSFAAYSFVQHRWDGTLCILLSLPPSIPRAGNRYGQNKPSTAAATEITPATPLLRSSPKPAPPRLPRPRRRSPSARTRGRWRSRSRHR